MRTVVLVVRAWLMVGPLVVACGPASSPAPADASIDATGVPADRAGCTPDLAWDAAVDADALDPGAPFCCTSELCADVGMACNARTCRCEAVPCALEGDACDPRLLPGVEGELVCAAVMGGLFCQARVDRVEQCPSHLRWCSGGDPGACLCGGGCRFFLDRCPGDLPCVPGGGGENPTGVASAPCRGLRPGLGAEGQPCDAATSCASGLVCLALEGGPRPFCARPDCGLAEGAPDCPTGRVCLPLGPSLQLGVCRVACDPYDLRAPCAADERCLWRDPGPRGRPGGACVKVSEGPLPGAGAACSGPCRTGHLCVDGFCLEACDPRAVAPSDAACPSGQECIAAEGVSVCAPPCDPIASASARGCAPDRYCAVRADECGQPDAHCMPRPALLPRLDERCWDRCDSRLVCSGGAAGRCRPACVAGVGGGGCAPGERCFVVAPRDRSAPTASLGYCDRPCAVGGADCRAGSWCEPRELDASTDRWIGTCL